MDKKRILVVLLSTVMIVIAGSLLIASSGIFGASGGSSGQGSTAGQSSGSGEESKYTSDKTVADTTPAVAHGSVVGGTGADSAKKDDSKAISVSGGTDTLSNLTISASGTDESGVKVTDAGELTLTNCTITTSGDASSEEDSNFSGANAGILATTGSTIKLVNCTIKTTGDGANAVFATGEGSKIVLENCLIETSGDSSRGLDATYTGTVLATNVTIATKGSHCATLATDRGEGTVTVDNAVLNSEGDGSPVVYSTGSITLSNAVGVAAGAEAAVVEGKNSITLVDADLTSASKYGVMVYQSFSGDAGEGEGTVSIKGGSLVALVGPMFYSTNTTATIKLDNVDLTYDSNVLAAAMADRWGTSGSNGSKLTIDTSGKTTSGTTDADSISSITVNEG